MIHEQKGIVCDFASLGAPQWGTNQGLDNEPYVKHLFAMFRDMVHPNTTTLSYVTKKNGDKTCSFNTRVNDAFIWYYEHLYYYYCPVEESAPLGGTKGRKEEKYSS